MPTFPKMPNPWTVGIFGVGGHLRGRQTPFPPLFAVTRAAMLYRSDAELGLGSTHRVPGEPGIGGFLLHVLDRHGVAGEEVSQELDGLVAWHGFVLPVAVGGHVHERVGVYGGRAEPSNCPAVVEVARHDLVEERGRRLGPVVLVDGEHPAPVVFRVLGGEEARAGRADDPDGPAAPVKSLAPTRLVQVTE